MRSQRAATGAARGTGAAWATPPPRPSVYALIPVAIVVSTDLCPCPPVCGSFHCCGQCSKSLTTNGASLLNPISNGSFELGGGEKKTKRVLYTNDRFYCHSKKYGCQLYIDWRISLCNSTECEECQLFKEHLPLELHELEKLHPPMTTAHC